MSVGEAVVAILAVGVAVALAIFFVITYRSVKEKDSWNYVTVEALDAQLEWLTHQFGRFRWNLIKVTRSSNGKQLFTFAKRDEESDKFLKVWDGFDRPPKGAQPMIVRDAGHRSSIQSLK